MSKDMHRLAELAELLDDPRITPGLLADAIKEVAGGCTAEQADDDALADYRPWLHEGQAWKESGGAIGTLVFMDSEIGWEFRADQFWGKLVDVGGRPVGTVWDVLPKSVSAIQVQQYRAFIYTIEIYQKPHRLTPALNCALPDGWHDRPAWAANLPEASND